MTQDQDDLIADVNEILQRAYMPVMARRAMERCRDEISRLQAALESAQARVGELEGLLEKASNVMRMTALAMESPLGRVTKRDVIHWTSMFHQESQAIRRAILPSAPPPATEGGAS